MPVGVNPVQLLADRILIQVTDKRFLSAGMILSCTEYKNKRPLIPVN